MVRTGDWSPGRGWKLFQAELLLELGVIVPQTFRELLLQLLVLFLQRKEVIQIGRRGGSVGCLLPLLVGLLRYTRLPCRLLDRHVRTDRLLDLGE